MPSAQLFSYPSNLLNFCYSIILLGVIQMIIKFPLFLQVVKIRSHIKNYCRRSLSPSHRSKVCQEGQNPCENRELKKKKVLDFAIISYIWVRIVGALTRWRNNWGCGFPDNVVRHYDPPTLSVAYRTGMLQGYYLFFMDGTQNSLVDV